MAEDWDYEIENGLPLSPKIQQSNSVQNGHSSNIPRSRSRDFCNTNDSVDNLRRPGADSRGRYSGWGRGCDIHSLNKQYNRPTSYGNRTFAIGRGVLSTCDKDDRNRGFERGDRKTFDRNHVRDNRRNAIEMKVPSYSVGRIIGIYKVLTFS